MASEAIASRQLTAGTTIEDHLPSLDLYVVGAARYANKVALLKGLNQTPTLEDELLSDFRAQFPKLGSTKGVAAWVLTTAATKSGISGKLSKVGVAREYVDLILARDDSPTQLRRLLELANWLTEAIGLTATASPSLILQADESN